MKIKNKLHKAKNKNASVTIAICTHNRKKYLNLCLASLMKSIKDHNFKVIVVLNCCIDGSEELLKKYKKKLKLTYYKEQRIGLSNAKNKATYHTKTKYIVFLDDDAKPHSNWCDAIKKAIKTFDPDMFGGPFVPYYIEKKPDWFIDELGSSHLNTKRGIMADDDYLSGGNMGWKTKLLRSLGGFDTTLGMSGKNLSLGEETSLQARYLTGRSKKRVFIPEMKILHYVHPDKMKVLYVAKRSLIYGYLLSDINKLNSPSLMRSIKHLLFNAKLGFPLLLRILIRDKNKYKFWKTYAANYLSYHMIYFGCLLRHMKQKVNFNQAFCNKNKRASLAF